MDSHCTGPRGRGYGAIVSASGIGRVYTDTAETGKELLRTTGASADNPILVRINGVITTAFDGFDPVFRLVETNLDGSGSVVIANISDFSSGKFALTKVLTVDKIYKLVASSDTDGDQTFADGISLNADATYESAAANFVAGDAGKSITGTNIPAATTILSVTDDDTIELSANASAAGTGLSFTIHGRTPTTAGAAAYFIEVCGPGQLP